MAQFDESLLREIPLTELRGLAATSRYIRKLAQTLVPDRLARLAHYRALAPFQRVVESVTNGDLDIADEEPFLKYINYTERVFKYAIDMRNQPLINYIFNFHMRDDYWKSEFARQLGLAADFGYENAVRMLVDAGVPAINYALESATSNGQIHIVKYLVGQGAVAFGYALEQFRTIDPANISPEDQETSEYLESLRRTLTDDQEIVLVTSEQYPSARFDAVLWKAQVLSHPINANDPVIQEIRAGHEAYRNF